MAVMKLLNELRDDTWLDQRFSLLFQNHFSDIVPTNEIVIKFGRKSRTRLGSIGMTGWQSKNRAVGYRGRGDHGVSVITLTSYFQLEAVPEEIIDATIAHELVHYVHGFHSPRPQLYAHPHRGGVVETELERRGLLELTIRQQKWLADNWRTIVGPSIKPRKRRRYVRLSFLPAY